MQPAWKLAALIVGSSVIVAVGIWSMIYGLVSWLGDLGGILSIAVIALGMFFVIALAMKETKR